MVVKKKAVPKKSASKKKAVVKKVSSKQTAVGKKTAVKKKPVSKKKLPDKTVVKKAVPKPVPAPKKAVPKATKKPAMPKMAVASTLSLHGINAYKEKRGEIYMNTAQSEHFNAILENWKMELMQEVDRTVHHMQDEAANFPDPNDRASQESEFALELRTRDRERKLIKKIDEALKNLENQDYGYCDVCGIEIGIRRLEARPTATQCIDCKTLDEIREKQSPT